MTAYQNMMEQIALDEDTLREKAAQMQKMSAHRTIRQHRTGKHHMLRLTAAAAAVLVFGTVTVGAVNGWDYKGIFTKYFSSKSEQAVDYDFTGMGLDLGDVIEGDGYTLTLDALLTDSRNVYIAYHYTGNYDCYTDVIYADIVTANSRPHEFLKYQGSCEPECDKDGIHHGILDVRLRNSDISLADKQLTLSVNGQKLTYPLSDITVQEGISVPYNGTLPNDLNETKFDKVDLTPLMMEFTKVVYDRHEGMLDFNEVFGENRVPVEITAVYADGSEKTVKPLESHDGAFESSTLQPDGSYRHELERPYYFASPVKLDGLTAMRINGTEIPIQNAPEMNYDYSGMGMDINQVIPCSQYTVCIQAALADSDNLYIAYDLELDSETAEFLADKQDVCILPQNLLLPVLQNADSDQGYCSPLAKESDGRYHGVTVNSIPAGIDLANQKLQFSLPGFAIRYCESSEASDTKLLHLPALHELTEPIALREITVQEGKTMAFGKTLPAHTDGIVYDTVTVTPFMLKFDYSDNGNQIPAANPPETETLSAVFADGTEKTLPLFPDSMGNPKGCCSMISDADNQFQVSYRYLFANPLRTDDIIAFRINGTEIPIK